MNRLEAVSARLLRPDLSQGGTLLLAVLAVVLVANWPNGGARVNESWAVVGPLRSSALALLAVVLGARQAGGAGAWPRFSESEASFRVNNAAAHLEEPLSAEFVEAAKRRFEGPWFETGLRPDPIRGQSLLTMSGVLQSNPDTPPRSLARPRPWAADWFPASRSAPRRARA